MKPLTIHAKAAQEIRRAAAWYERQREGLGHKFRLEIERAFDRVRRIPRAVAPLDERGTRKQRLHRFPYTVYYVELEESIWIAAVGHQKRRPGFWSDRDPKE